MGNISWFSNQVAIEAESENVLVSRYIVADNVINCTVADYIPEFGVMPPWSQAPGFHAQGPSFCVVSHTAVLYCCDSGDQ